MPIFGVLVLDWHVFELIVVYWLENVVIGLFTALRFVVRRYQHAIDLAMPLFFAPFFAVHYGGFTAGHGLFVFKLFGEDWAAVNDIVPAYFFHELMFEQGLAFAFIALFLLHARVWWEEVQTRGIGADGVFVLMTSPYRRIVVLHVTILVGGFALREMGEPALALLLLVVLKTAFDLHNHKKRVHPSRISAKKLAMIEAAVVEKKFQINGQDHQFETVTEMTQSRYFATAMAFLRLMLSKEELAAADDVMAEKIALEMDRAELAAGGQNADETRNALIV